MIGGAAVAGDGHVVQHRQPEQRLHVDVVRLRRERVPEEEYRVDPPLSDQCTELGIAAHRTGEHQLDRGIER